AATYNTKKLILDWTGFFGTPMTDRYFEACPVMNDRCHLVSDRSLLPQASAVLFHIPNLQWNDIPAPEARLPSHRYVFFSHESSQNSPIDDLRSRSYFNWTMVMRSDADAPWPYG